MAKAEIEAQDKQGDVSQDLLKVVQVIWKSPRLTLMGDPGVGKTTLTQWLMCSLCHASDNYAKQNLGQLFPLLLTVRKLKPDLPKSAQVKAQLDNKQFIETIITSQADCLRQQLLGQNNPKAFDCLMACFTSGQLMLIIDGLDEISAQTAQWLQSQLRQLLGQYPKIRLLMTSRVVGFDPLAFWQIKSNDCGEPDGLDIEAKKELTTGPSSKAILVTKEYLQQNNLPCEYYLAPFTPSQRKQFATNWVNHYLPPVEDKRQSFMLSMENVSNHNIQLNALSRIPVLLNLICFVLWRRGKLPDGRAELYQDIVRTYLTTMDKSRGIEHELADEYDYQDIKGWLGKLALQMHCGDLVKIGNLDAMGEENRETLREQMPQVKGERLLQVSKSQLQQFLQLQLSEVLDCGELTIHSKQLIYYLQTRTGFLIPKGQLNGEEQFGFSHLSFQEYFAAYAISLNTGSLDASDSFGAELIATTYESAWSEVWQLVFEQLSLVGTSRKQIERLLKQVFPQIFEGLEGLEGFERFERFELYSKIILNPAVKLVANNRGKIKLQLVSGYLASFYSSDLLDGLTDECYHQNKLKTALLDPIVQYQPQRLIFTDKQLPRGLINDCLANLALVSQLNFLTIIGTEIDNYDWLQNAKQLKHLVINHALKLSQVNVKMLSDFTQLQVLAFTNTKISDFGWLRRLTQLQVLYLRHSGFNGLAELAELKQLRKLDVRGCPIISLVGLPGLPGLHGLPGLPGLPKLKELLIDKRVADNSPDEVAALKVKGVRVLF